MKAGQLLGFDAAAASKCLQDTASERGTAEVEVTVGDGPFEGKAWRWGLSRAYVFSNVTYTIESHMVKASVTT